MRARRAASALPAESITKEARDPGRRKRSRATQYPRTLRGVTGDSGGSGGTLPASDRGDESGAPPDVKRLGTPARLRFQTRWLGCGRNLRHRRPPLRLSRRRLLVLHRRPPLLHRRPPLLHRRLRRLWDRRPPPQRCRRCRRRCHRLCRRCRPALWMPGRSAHLADAVQDNTSISQSAGAARAATAQVRRFSAGASGMTREAGAMTKRKPKRLFSRPPTGSMPGRRRAYRSAARVLPDRLG